MYGKIDNYCIQIVHGFLGTELTQYEHFTNKVIPLLNLKEVGLLVNEPCGSCYYKGIRENIISPNCYRCNSNNKVSINFEQFKQTPQGRGIKLWKVLASSGYVIFLNAFRNTDQYTNHFKDELCYEIPRGPNLDAYELELFDKINMLMIKNRF